MSTSNQSSATNPDYVYFERSASQFSKSTLEKAQAAKLKLEHYYKKSVEEAKERIQRYVGSKTAFKRRGRC
jgi:protein-serine/threonine kinase